MVNLIIDENDCALVDGIPDYYISDEDFEVLLKDKELQHGLYQSFGCTVSIGRLGKVDDTGVYRECVVHEIGTFDDNVEGMSFYEKVL